MKSRLESKRKVFEIRKLKLRVKEIISLLYSSQRMNECVGGLQELQNLKRPNFVFIFNLANIYVERV